jgi:hypothetical protein
MNAWSEISALAASGIMTNVVGWIPGIGGHFAPELVVIVIVSTIVWLGVTFLTPPTDSATLEAFYRRIRPGGWWGPIARRCSDVVPDQLSPGWTAWVAGVVLIYAAMFGLGDLCLARYARGSVFLGVAALASWYFVRRINAVTPAYPSSEQYDAPVSTRELATTTGDRNAL